MSKLILDLFLFRGDEIILDTESISKKEEPKEKDLENLEEEDLSNWNIAICPICRKQIDLLKAKYDEYGEVICYHR